MVLAAGAGLWVFADGLWFASDLGHRLIDRERASSFIDPLPLVAADLPHGRIDKIVAVCDDLAVAAVLERDGGAALAGRAEVSRSQPFYCDFTHNLAQKGLGLARLAELAGVPLGQVAALGDGTNDIPMLRAAGLSFAMGQGSEPVRAAAGRVTASNQEDGVAAAIDSLLDEGLATPAAG
jgi:hydroxymethylpyrimidine pyrophosphatase-like HAD family hydrolase